MDFSDRGGEEARFRYELERSHRATLAVAGFLRRAGLLVLVPEIVVRPDFAARAAYGDAGDLEVLSAYGRKRGEVKWRRLDFADCASYPFATVNIDRANKPVADYYFIVNRAISHVAMIIAADTRSAWRCKTTTDGVKAGYRPFAIYRCPKEACLFARL